MCQVRGCPFTSGRCPDPSHRPDDGQPTAADLARARFRQRVEQGLPDAAQPALAIRTYQGGRPSLIHLSAVRAIARPASPHGGRRFERQPGDTLCPPTGTDQAGRVTVPVTTRGAAVPITCRECLAIAGRYRIAWPHDRRARAGDGSDDDDGSAADDSADDGAARQP
jgi:hypothetical protein